MVYSLITWIMIAVCAFGFHAWLHTKSGKDWLKGEQ